MKAIFILVSLILFSCASRKVNTQISEVKKDSLVVTLVDTKIETKKDTDSETNINTFIDSDEIIIKPLDSLKEIIVDGKHYKNVVLTIKKTKTNSLYNNKEKVSENALKQQKKSIKVQTKQVENKKSKVIDKKANYFIYLWFLLGLIILYLIYKYKRFFLI
jgi:type III secretory pathway lipoprotein EscJ